MEASKNRVEERDINNLFMSADTHLRSARGYINSIRDEIRNLVKVRSMNTILVMDYERDYDKLREWYDKLKAKSDGDPSQIQSPHIHQQGVSIHQHLQQPQQIMHQHLQQSQQIMYNHFAHTFRDDRMGHSAYPQSRPQCDDSSQNIVIEPSNGVSFKRKFYFGSHAYSVAVSNDESCFAICVRYCIYMCNIDSGAYSTIDLTTPIEKCTCITASDDFRFLGLFSQADKSVLLILLEGIQAVKLDDIHKDVLSIVFSQDNSNMVVVCRDRTVFIKCVSVTGAGENKKLDPTNNSILDMLESDITSVSNNSDHLILGLESGKVVIVNLDFTENITVLCHSVNSPVRSTLVCDDILITSHADRSIRLTKSSLLKKEVSEQLVLENGEVLSLASPANSKNIIYSVGESIVLYDYSTKSPIANIKSSFGTVHQVIHLHSRGVFLTCHEAGFVCVWDLNIK